MTIYKSNWGYHPCSYETYLKLKKLKKYYWETAREYAAWTRWARKDPQNRVIIRVRNRGGRRLKPEVLGPMPEPKFCEFFVQPDRPMPDGYYVENIPACLNDHDVLGDFEDARMPKKTEEEVTPIVLTEKQIDDLLAQAEEYFTS